MNTTEKLVKWEYELNYHIPVALSDDGSVEWVEHCATYAISLPACIENPCEFLSKSGYDDRVDIINFSGFSKVGE